MAATTSFHLFPSLHGASQYLYHKSPSSSSSHHRKCFLFSSRPSISAPKPCSSQLDFPPPARPSSPSSSPPSTLPRAVGVREAAAITSPSLLPPKLFPADQKKNTVDRAAPGSPKNSKWVSIQAEPLTRETFSVFGDLIEAVAEDAPHGDKDAVVHLSKGIPRLYVMRLRNRPLRFERLTHHAAVTQTLGAVGSNGAPWYLAVARPSLVCDQVEVAGEQNVFLSPAGHRFVAPTLEEVRVFRVEGSQMVNLRVGTWHQGPFFEPPTMDFYNLELSNTGEVDHTCHAFGGVQVKIVDTMEP